ncbi:MAG: Sensor protein KdpD, partial [Betaproteobacteria bacterium]|nr:Sensor protein KdpD [Betaproteobacteria bacterium]
AATPQAAELALLTRSRAYLGLRNRDAQPRKRRYRGYAWSLGTTAIATMVCGLMFERLELANLVMVYLVGVVVVATRFGRGPSAVASLLSVAAFDFFFVRPRFSFAVTDIEYAVMFAVMLLVGLVISTLAANLRSQAKVASYRERRASVLYALTRELAAARREDEVARIAVTKIAEEFEGPSVLLLPDADGKIRYPTGHSIHGSFHAADLAVAQWVYDHGQIAGQGTDTLPGTEGVYFPVKGPDATIAVLALIPVNLRRVFLPEQQRLMDTFITQVLQAIERVRLAREAQAANVKAHTEGLRNSLLSAISHDFRTPLAAIVGASSSVADPLTRLSDEARVELGRTIYEEAQRMSRLANSLLDLARLEAGSVALHRQWSSVEEIVGSVVTRLQSRMSAHPVAIVVPATLPLVNVDPAMIEQVLENLLENAAKYTPSGTSVELGAEARRDEIAVWVADRGPGLPPGTEERLFDKFYQAQAERAQSGVGLGLTICRAIVDAHGGTITASTRADGGAVFRFTLPAAEEPPRVEAECEPTAITT